MQMQNSELHDQLESLTRKLEEMERTSSRSESKPEEPEAKIEVEEIILQPESIEHSRTFRVLEENDRNSRYAEAAKRMSELGKLYNLKTDMAAN